MTKNSASEENQFKAKDRRAQGEFVRGISSFRHAMAMRISRLSRGAIICSSR